ncbi:MAG: hypothetical protein K1X83_02080 [Oligoflexia bacterium]|nr:hypothetical protein [Oligoflexia bacterium]
MRIQQVKSFKLGLKLNEPMAIAFHVFRFAEIFFIELHSEDGFYGIGEGSPFTPLTGELESDIRAEVQALNPEALPEFSDPDEFWAAIHSKIRSVSLRSALDLAAHDLVARSRGLPVCKLYRPNVLHVPNSVTIFLKETPEATLAEGRRILELYPGLQVIKIKLKGEGDVERCKKLRELRAPRLSFSLDANQGYLNGDRAIRALTEICSDLGKVMLIEEPCPRGDLELTSYVRKGMRGVPIFADESCLALDELRQIIAAQAFDGINIKLQKLGGMTPALEIAALAQKHGMGLMVGQMLEGPLGSATGAHFASAAGGVVLTDLDMDLELPQFCLGQLPMLGGIRLPTDRPGFGVDLDRSMIEQLRLTHDATWEEWR